MKFKYLAVAFCTAVSILTTGCGNSSSAASNESSEIQLVDITQLSDTMAYTEVYNMITNPDAYYGKMIKVSGLFYADHYDDTGMTYFYLVTNDTTGCCSQGLEFVWDNNEHTYPDDYPEDETTIEITGIYGTYNDDGTDYWYINADEMKILE